MLNLVTALGSAAIALAIAAPALAHVTVQPDEAPAGAFFRFVVRVPNERDAADTTTVEVRFPDLMSVSFQPKAGWDRTVTMRPLDRPIEAFGRQVTEVVDTVTWKGGAIAPHEFEEFAFTARTPDDATQLEFPAIQTYSNGETVRWVGPPDADQPAARVQVIALGAGDAGELAVLAATSRQIGDVGVRAWIGAGLGALGLLMGLAALLVARRRGRGAPAQHPTTETAQQPQP